VFTALKVRELPSDEVENKVSPSFSHFTPKFDRGVFVGSVAG
jgi:hypothetical protein